MGLDSAYYDDCRTIYLMNETQTLFGLPFFSGTVTQAVDLIWKKILDNEFVTVATPNPEQIVQMKEHAQFSQALKTFDLFLPDGQGIVWAARKAGRPLHERIPGVDVVRQLLDELNSTDGVGLLIGGRGYDEAPNETGAKKMSGAAEIQHQRAEKREEIHSDKDTQVVIPKARFMPLPEFKHLYWLENFDKQNPNDTQLALEWIQKNHPMMVFVALGAPYQEMWIAKYREQLQKAGVRCVMVVGGTFDVLTGRVQRAPDIMQNLGLEWLWRLIKEPWRWRRQLRLIRYLILVLSGEKNE